ncbi:MAG: hypothetical protein RLZZ582_1132, partial [Verrucomicrobiota bacterium]
MRLGLGREMRSGASVGGVTGGPSFQRMGEFCETLKSKLWIVRDSLRS